MLSFPTAVNIASASGSVTDRRYEFAELVRCEDIDFVVGDWMSEYNMTTRGGSKVGGDSQGSEYEECFLESILPALEHLDARGIKVAVNAGASDTKKLHDYLVQTITDRGLSLNVAWVEGDEVFDSVQKARADGVDFRSLTTGTMPSIYVETHAEKSRSIPQRLGLRADICSVLPGEFRNPRGSPKWC
jgi:hypothetical protein